jgi:hypothetical protein
MIVVRTGNWSRKEKLFDSDERHLSWFMAGQQPLGDIDWAAGRKEKSVSDNSWAIRTVSERVKAAAEDLRRAGYEREASVLTAARLNTAWQRLGSAERTRLKGLRDQKAQQNARYTQNLSRSHARKAQREDRIQGRRFRFAPKKKKKKKKKKC